MTLSKLTGKLKSSLILPALLLLSGPSGCAVTTGATEGSVDTVENTAEASTKLSSSTSPSDDSVAETQSKEADIKSAKKFASYNIDRLKLEMARGQGEYLDSLGILLGVDEDNLAEFRTLAREEYEQVFIEDGDNSSELLVRELLATVESNPDLKP